MSQWISILIRDSIGNELYLIIGMDIIKIILE